MDRYDSYKDSGVEWIGEIPKHWKLKKIKHHSEVNVGLVINPSTYYDDNGEIPIITGKNVSTNGIDISKVDRITPNSNELLYKTQIHTGDVVSMRVGYPGRSSVVKPEEDGYNCCSLIITRKSLTILPYLLNYIINSSLGKIQVELCQGGMGQQVVNLSDWNEFIIPTTSISEQQQIVSFLDDKTQKIDSLIQQKEKKIELLKEKRTSLINHVVTKGIDTNVVMKDSGVEWIGGIPNHWVNSKIKYGVNHLSEKGKPEKKDIKISPENVESGTGVCFNLYSEHESEGMRFQSGDILLNKLRLYLKKILFTDYDGFSLGEMIVLRTNNKLNNKYFYQLLFSQGLIDLLDSQSTGIKLPRVSPDVILNTEIVYPPLNEQQQIVEYLDKQTEEIDTLIQLEQKKIDTLKEYRQSLISEVVTGKIRVCEEDNSLSLNSQIV